MTIEEIKKVLKENEIKVKKEKDTGNAVVLTLDNPYNKDSNDDFIKWVKADEKTSARYHDERGEKLSWRDLYKKLTGKSLPRKSEGAKLIERLETLLAEDELITFKSTYGITYVGFRQTDADGNTYYRNCDINSEEFNMSLSVMLYNQTGVLPDVAEARTLLKLKAYESGEKYELHKRICNMGSEIWYMLDEQSIAVISPEYEEPYIAVMPEKTFITCQGMKNQVMPDFDARAEDLEELIIKNFHFTKKSDRILFTLYLCCCFFGVDAIHEMPVLALAAEKGSSKSVTLRRLQAIVDPHTMDLTTIPKNREEIAIRLDKALVSCFDNLSYLSQDVSDLFCQSATGGTFTKRELYTNTGEIALNIKGIVAINGTSLVATASDLLERCIILNLKKLKPSELKSEQELQEVFDEELPRILGAIMDCVRQVLGGEFDIQTDYKTRMTHFSTTAVKCGIVLGYKEEDIVEILKANQRHVNEQALEENLVAQAVMLYMDGRKEARMSVTDFYGALKDKLAEKNISTGKFPEKPNGLSRKLNEIRSNLENEYKIVFNVKNTGAFKQITITNNAFGK